MASIEEFGRVNSMSERKRVVVIGGGTGSFVVLSGLKKFPLDLTAVVAMADDGGSTGVLRDELGVLPPGDVRQCLVALSESDQLMRELMNYRFTNGSLEGHSFGNLLLSALEKVTGSFDQAVEKASSILRISGHVVPATLDKVELVAHLRGDGEVRGQSKIHKTNLEQLEQIKLEPEARANPKAVAAIKQADLIVIGPGDFYSSLVPNLLVQGIPEAIQMSQARVVYIANLMTKTGHTEQFSVEDFVAKIELYLGKNIDAVIYNTFSPKRSLLNKYAREGEVIVEVPTRQRGKKYVGFDLVSRKFPTPRPGDPLVRTYIRHEPTKLAESILAQL